MAKNNNHAAIKKRLEAFIKKAEGGDVESIFTLAFMYSKGVYLPKDYVAAEAWLRKAGDLGSDEARKRLAKLLTEGSGLAQDYEEAFDIYHDLMLCCDVDAMAEVGVAYKLGRGIPKDEELGAFFINQAFEIELDLMRDEIKKDE